jgi:hypothetical protein
MARTLRLVVVLFLSALSARGSAFAHATDASEAADGPSIEFLVFTDEIGAQGQTETRSLIRSAAAYQAYFGHVAPSEVDFATMWVIFYSAGSRTTGGYSASVTKVIASEPGLPFTLKVTTSLKSPGKDCVVNPVITKAFVLARFKRPFQTATAPVVRFYQDDTVANCGRPPSPPLKGRWMQETG